MKAYCNASVLLKTLVNLKQKETSCIERSEREYKSFKESLNKQLIEIYETQGIDIIGTGDDHECLKKFVERNFLRRKKEKFEYFYDTECLVYLSEGISATVQIYDYYTSFAEHPFVKGYIKPFQTQGVTDHCVVFILPEFSQQRVSKPNKKFGSLIERVQEVSLHPAMSDIVLEEEDLDTIRSIENLIKQFESE